MMCTDREVFDATSPNEQFSDWFGAEPVIEQPAVAGLIDQFTPAPPGSGSARVTPVAVPAPVLETVIVKPIGSPALTESASAVLVICTAGHCRVVEADACTCGLFVACALAVFGYVVHGVPTEVGLVTCTEAEPPGARSPSAHVRVPAWIEQVPGPAYAGLIDQLMPVPVGSGSEIATACAVPAPVLETVIVNPRLLPMLTVDASADLAIVRFGQLTVIDAEAWTEPSFVAVAVAVFG